MELATIAHVEKHFSVRSVESPRSAVHLRKEVARQLRRNMALLTEAFGLDSNYTERDAAALVLAAIDFVESAVVEKPAAEDWRIDDMPGVSMRQAPWGKCIIALPANAVLPLAVILPCAFLEAGNELVVSAPRNGHRTMAIVDQCMQAAGYPFAWFSGGTRQLVDHCIGTASVDCLYYVGSSSALPDLAARCAAVGIELIYEGEGRGAMVVAGDLAPEQVRAAAIAVVEAKDAWNGQMCSAPDTIFVHQTVADSFRSAFEEESKRRRRAARADVMTEKARAFVSQMADKGGRPSPLDGLTGAMQSPTLLWVEMPSGIDSAIELFGPVAMACEFADPEDVIRQVNLSRFGLQLSIFTLNTELAKSFIQRVSVARVCVNMLPVNQNPSYPWGAYGRSGRSEVCTFSEKAYRKTVVESWGKPSSFAKAPA